MRACLAFVAVLAVVAAPAAAARTWRVDWRESKALETGSVAFRVTRIVVDGTRWSATASVANRSPFTLDVVQPKTLPGAGGRWTIKDAGFGIGFRVRSQDNCFVGCGWGGYWFYPSRTAKPVLPTRLAPDAIWSGTFSGTGKLPRRNDLRLSFGYFRIAAAPQDKLGFVGTDFNWITDHSFRL